MIRTDSKRGRIALMVAHCAGMVDLVALPVWVGVLMAHYRFDPQQAGGLVTLFLAGAVLASLWLAPRFHRLRGRLVAPLAFAASGACFIAAASTADFALLALVHLAGGVAAGTALSVTHGTIGRDANPHKLFALVGIALGVFAVVFMAFVPRVVQSAGGPVLFQVFGGLMVLAAVITAFLFPDMARPSAGEAAVAVRADPLPRAVWLGIVGVGCMALVQAMVFSFLERMGNARGFGVQPLNALLIAIGLVNLFPAAIAGLLQKRLDAAKVVLGGALVQALLAIVMTWSSGFEPYAGSASVFVAVMIFSHTFAFGLLARLDPTGRAVAATPAMLMVGAAIGPVLGGTLVKAYGYPALGTAALIVDLVAAVLFACVLALRSRTGPSGAAVPRTSSPS
ncbi:MFS transporter [Caenimonas sedimenti]|uniref:MFS transporter n=1 Tax=Caenimonas sedimenti TaxID=2596921 RepID=A0A562ZXP5_9BURK|nr:MFS transporter [Caenimonas sedimenti]TWO72914.1 MFS transporter [Caenimonas sedimenti]